MDILDKLGNKRYLLPLGALVVLGAFMTLLAYPTINSSPKDLPLAAVNLDEGIKTPAGEMNAGKTLTEKLSQAPTTEGEVAPVKWTTVDSKQALDEDFDNQKYYAALVVPSGFTASQAAAKAGAGEAKPVEIIVDSGRNPAGVQMAETMLGTLVAKAGLESSTTHLNQSGQVSNPASAMILVQLTFTITMICSYLVFLVTRVDKKATRAEKIKSLKTQSLLVPIYSGLVGLTVPFVAVTISGLDVPFWPVALATWFTSFCLMVFFVGMLDIAIPLGVLAVVALMFGGLGTIMLPYEFLPELWQKFIYPWVPQPFVADGTRQMVSYGQSAINSGNLPLIWYAVIGLVAASFSPLLVKSKPVKKTKSAKAN